MAGAGLLLLAVCRPAWPRRELTHLLGVGVLGIAVTQYTWFAAIEHSNVATATFIQYSGVPMTAGWQMLRRQIRPEPRRLTALVAAATGLALLVLGQPGGVHALRLSPLGVVFALVSAVAFAYYMLSSARVVQSVGLPSAVARGMTLGSIPVLV
jgi:drug/metabolite transporter (DMT)-like permease